MRKSHDIDEKTTMNDILGVRPSNNEEYTKFFCPGIDCSTCKAGGGKHFKSAKLLLQHYQKVHSEKRQKCSDCSAKFSLERDLRYHRKKICPNRNKDSEIDAPGPSILSPKSGVKTNDNSAQTERWIIPTTCVVISNHRKICPRMSQKLPQQKDISVQTDHDYGTAVCHNSNGDAAALCFNPYCSGQTMDQIAQVQMESSLDTTDYHQYQHSYAQTIYPQTIDFGAQYPVACGSTYVSPAIYFKEPLNFEQVSSTQMSQSASIPVVRDFGSEEARNSRKETSNEMFYGISDNE